MVCSNSTDFNIGFDKGLQEIAFIPPEEGEDLLKVSEAILDETGITTIIKPQAIKSALGIDKYLHFIDNSLKKPEKFKELGVEIFNFDKLVEFLKKYSLSYSQEYLDILKHLQEKGYGNKISGKQVQIIYDDKGKFIASTADCPIYFQPLKDDKDLLTFADFSFIHPDLDLICKEDPDIRSCLESLGVKEFNPIEIIKDRIRKNQHKLINKKGIDYLNYIWFIFKYRGELTHDNYQELSKLEIVYGTDGNYYLSVASDCYLSDHYKPDYPPAIAQGLGQEKFNFIVPEYIRKSENESVEAWRQFFLNIGVKEVTAIELVRQEMNSLLDKPSETIIKNVVQITTKIFNHRQELTQDDFERLSNLPILLKNNQLAPAKECYFAKEYQPKQDLEDLFAGTSFTKIISGKYIVNRNHQDWKEFFKKIKISEEIRIERLSQANIESFAPEVKSAFKEFAKKPLVFTLRKYLLVPDLIRFYSNPNFAEKIWKYISKNWDRFSPANNETIYVTDFFKFLVTEYPSIPCTDNQCRKPSDIYSSSLKNSLANCDLHISAIELPKDIEEFLGLKNSLDVQACLKIVDRIIRNFEPERDLRELEFFYQKLSKICHDHPSNSNKALIIDWSNTGKLIGCDDLLHPISQLFYLDPNTRLSHKRNPQLVKFPQEDQKIFESFLAILRIHKIGNFSITYDFDRFDPILPNVITERVKYLSIYLINSIDPELVSAKEQEILNLLKLVTFNNPSQGIGINPEHWGRWGEDIAKTFYEEHSYTVEKQADVRGYDFLCSGSNDELFVEVKTISSSNDVIRITRNEWDNMCKSENQEKYELFIVVHKGEHKEKTIRVKSAWKTLVQVLLKINNYPLTPCEYNSSNIEAVLGFQRSSNGKSNDIIFNWKRLLEESRNLFPTSNPNIEIISY